MTTRIVCYPLLGQSTVVVGDRVDITVVLVPDNNEETSREVALWYGMKNCVWEQLDLMPIHDSSPILLTGDSQGPGPLSYSCSLSRVPMKEGGIFFTIKYRKAGDPTWKWVNDDINPVGDAEIIFQSPSLTATVNSLEYYISNISKSLTIKYFGPHDESQSRVWTFSYPVAAPTSSATERIVQRLNIGVPANLTRYFALVRKMSFWLVPRHGRNTFELGEDNSSQFYRGESSQEEAILISFLRSDGMHLVMLALSMNGVETMLTSGYDGNIILIGKNENEQEGNAVVVCAIGKTVEDGIEATMNFAKHLVRKSSNAESLSGERSDKPESVAENQLGESFHDELVYCTWNSLGPKLTSTALFEAIDDLEKSRIYPSTIIIDDGWQSVTPFGSESFPNQQRWSRFEASSTSFPEGLADISSQIRKLYPWIKTIGVWHGIFGYWGGIEPDGEIGLKYKLRWVEINNHHKSGIWVIDAGDVKRFYDDFYSFLVSCGINAVKLDTQGLLDDLKNPGDRRELIPAYQNAVHESLASHFEDRVISCMSQYPSNIFSPQILLSSSTSLSRRISMRNSDDFWPNDPSSDPWHIHSNSHTSHLTAHLENIIPDWDMFQTASLPPSSQQMGYPTYHAAARSLSGGLISITDIPSHHSTIVLSNMLCTAYSHSSNSASPPILRVNPGKSSHVYSSEKEIRISKILTSTLESGVGILGLFNPLPSGPITELIGLEDIFSKFNSNEDSDDIEEYIIHAFTTGNTSKPISTQTLGTFASKVVITLPSHGYEILTAHRIRAIPLYRCLSHDSNDSPTDDLLRIAVLGQSGKFIGAAAVASISISVSAESRLVGRSKPLIRVLVKMKGADLLAHPLHLLGIRHDLVKTHHIRNHHTQYVEQEYILEVTVSEQSN